MNNKEWWYNKKPKKQYFIDHNDARQGEYASWWSNGQSKRQCFYKDGKLDGEYKKWRENGTLKIYRCYKNGELHGDCKTWWSNGRLESTISFENGKRGSTFYWFKNGNPELQYYNDKLGRYQGEFKKWSNGGILMVHRFHKNDLKHGEYIERDMFGRCVQHKLYENGKPICKLTNMKQYNFEFD